MTMQTNPILDFLQEISNVLDVSVLSRLSMVGQAPAEMNLYGVAQSMFYDMGQPVNSKCYVSLTINGKEVFYGIPAISMVGAETYELERAEEILDTIKDMIFYLERSHESVLAVKQNIKSQITIIPEFQEMFDAIQFQMSPLSKQLLASVIRLYVARLSAEYMETFATGKKLNIAINYKLGEIPQSGAAVAPLQNFVLTHEIV